MRTNHKIVIICVWLMSALTAVLRQKLAESSFCFSASIPFSDKILTDRGEEGTVIATATSRGQSCGDILDRVAAAG